MEYSLNNRLYDETCLNSSTATSIFFPFLSLMELLVLHKFNTKMEKSRENLLLNIFKYNTGSMEMTGW